ncbi:MAG: hypothetical protein V4773_07925, partial [Verrucomicrobiota bacterium]
GAVTPGVYVLKKEEATLSELLERAGGVHPQGTDRIDILFSRGEQVFGFTIRGKDFYAKNVDYLLPPKANVSIIMCEAVGFGNLTPSTFALLEESRRGYLKRRQEGKIEIKALK